MPAINTADYWGNQELADVTIRIGDVELKCHKFVLVQGSTYFRALLYLPDLRREALTHFQASVKALTDLESLANVIELLAKNYALDPATQDFQKRLLSNTDGISRFVTRPEFRKLLMRRPDMLDHCFAPMLEILKPLLFGPDSHMKKLGKVLRALRQRTELCQTCQPFIAEQIQEAMFHVLERDQYVSDESGKGAVHDGVRQVLRNVRVKAQKCEGCRHVVQWSILDVFAPDTRGEEERPAKKIKVEVEGSV
ncbi:hypothetical protein LTR78_010256 [Recurvomyces mirabilis]|uniref:BTB domain-containing protein n=1 Tax=Recurvomyces mirabilis TaxID=574656 RepID=A0AAE0TN54_9PEZI|nr:hypothetical protein LTR78_010256 [Recurvomyces mirabilis]KAK5156398.1 hypothetical protein LTS14_005286 [Recurvomyces mirabilis]